MTLNNLLSEFTDDAILNALIEYDPESDRESYQEALIELRNKQVILDFSSSKIAIQKNEDDESLSCVSKDENGEIFGIGFIPWGEWLGKEIDETSFEIVSKPKFLAIVLWEITFNGFCEEDTLESIDLLEIALENILNGESNKNLEIFCAISELGCLYPDYTVSKLINLIYSFTEMKSFNENVSNEELNKIINKLIEERNDK